MAAPEGSTPLSSSVDFADQSQSIAQPFLSLPLPPAPPDTADPMIGIIQRSSHMEGLTADTAPPWLLYSFRNSMIFVWNDVTAERAVMSINQFVLDQSRWKSLDLLRPEDLSIDGFRAICSEKIGFVGDMHMFYWKCQLSNDEPLILSADSEDYWRQAMNWQHFHQKSISFAFHEREIVQRHIDRARQKAFKMHKPLSTPTMIPPGTVSTAQQDIPLPPIIPPASNNEPSRSTSRQPYNALPHRQSSTHIVDDHHDDDLVMLDRPPPNHEEIPAFAPLNEEDMAFHNSLEPEQQLGFREMPPEERQKKRNEYLSRTVIIERLRDRFPNMKLPQIDLKPAMTYEKRTKKVIQLPEQELNSLFTHFGGSGWHMESSTHDAELDKEVFDMQTIIDHITNLESSVCGRVHEPTKDSMWKFLGLDEEATEIASTAFRIPGTRRHLKMFQLYCSWDMLRRMHEKSRSANGVFLADQTGFGKTIEIISLLVLLTAVNDSFYTLASSGSRRTEVGHLSAAAQTSSTNAGCKAEASHKTWLPCPCSYTPESIGTKLNFKIKEGPVLILAPKALLLNWANEILASVNTRPERPNRFEIFYAYGFDSDTRYQLDKRGFRLFNEDVAKELATDANGNQKPGQTRKWVISSFKAASSRLWEVIKKAEVTVKWSVIAVDEFHQAGSKDTELMKALRQDSATFTIGNPFQVFASATPIEKDTREIAGPLGAMMKQFVVRDKSVTAGWKWNSDTISVAMQEALYPVSPMLAAETGKSLESVMKYKRSRGFLDQQRTSELEAGIQKIRNLLQTTMIKRGSESKWYGNPCLTTPWLLYYDVTVPAATMMKTYLDQLETSFTIELSNRLQKLQKDWDKKYANSEREPEIDRPERPTAMHYKEAGRPLRMAATLPFLACLLQEETFTSHRFNNDFALELDSKGAEHWFWKQYGKSLIKHSPKLARIRLIFEKLNKLRDVDGDKPRILIFSAFPFICAIIKLFVKECLGESVEWMSSKASGDDRNDMVARFQKKGENGCRCLVGTPAILGVGFNLPKGFYTIMSEPQFTRRAEQQGIGRQIRNDMVQPEPAIIVYRLLYPGISVEEAIRKRQTDRDALNTLPLLPAPGTLEQDVVEISSSSSVADEDDLENNGSDSDDGNSGDEE